MFAKGYPFRIGIQPGVFVERLKLIEAYNAEIISVEPELLAPVYEKGIEAFGPIIDKFVEETPNGYATLQLSNPDNVNAHYKHTGPEIWEDTDGDVEVFVGGVGTGGSTHGISKYLKEQNQDIKTIVVQPDPESVANSAVEGATDGGFQKPSLLRSTSARAFDTFEVKERENNRQSNHYRTDRDR